MFGLGYAGLRAVSKAQTVFKVRARLLRLRHGHLRQGKKPAVAGRSAGRAVRRVENFKRRDTVENSKKRRRTADEQVAINGFDLYKDWTRKRT
jgi:GTP cyclohydrolase III